MPRIQIFGIRPHNHDAISDFRRAMFQLRLVHFISMLLLPEKCLNPTLTAVHMSPFNAIMCWSRQHVISYSPDWNNNGVGQM